MKKNLGITITNTIFKSQIKFEDKLLYQRKRNTKNEYSNAIKTKLRQSKQTKNNYELK